MNKKKIIIIAASAVALLAIGIAVYLVFFANKKITISFDSNGGEKVASIKVKLGSTITLPTVNKEGYNFTGWYQGKTMVTNETKYKSNTTLVAEWEKIPDDIKTFKITFDSKGGSEVSSLTLECDKEIKLPANPTKKGYTFIAWKDKNEIPIGDGALLTCDDITLYANWMKNDSAEKPASKITYKCPDGYTLNGKNCEKTTPALSRCPSDTFEHQGTCVKVKHNTRKVPVQVCGTKTVNYGGGHTEEVQGELFRLGTSFCFYGVVNDSYEQQSRTNCESRSHAWNSSNNKCYYARDNANVNITNSCADSDYMYIANPNQFDGVNGLNGGCYPKFDKEVYCTEGTLTNGKCLTVINATEVKQ